MNDVTVGRNDLERAVPMISRPRAASMKTETREPVITEEASARALRDYVTINLPEAFRERPRLTIGLSQQSRCPRSDLSEEPPAKIYPAIQKELPKLSGA
ncbi:hypothetical protein ACVW1C_003309 [Bradyrhizobium sp. USDA 4011]